MTAAPVPVWEEDPMDAILEILMEMLEGRFRFDSDKKQICCANPGFSSSLRSKHPCAAILALPLST